MCIWIDIYVAWTCLEVSMLCNYYFKRYNKNCQLAIKTNYYNNAVIIKKCSSHLRLPNTN